MKRDFEFFINRDVLGNGYFVEGTYDESISCIDDMGVFRGIQEGSTNTTISGSIRDRRLLRVIEKIAEKRMEG